MAAKPVAGQRVLVFAASGGVGHVAVQLAKALGLTTVGVTGNKNTVRAI
jgi:NADPH:quinone reductase-like Zn-dependent oxidoreductase